MSFTPPLNELPALVDAGGRLHRQRFEGGEWPEDYAPEELRWSDCEFYGCSFASAPLESLSADGCKFIHCSFRLADLSESRFDHCTFYDSETSEGSAFALANLTAACFLDCNLNMCDFTRASLYRVEIHRCQAQGAQFRHADCTHQISDRVTLASAILQGSNLSYTDLSGANLRECDFSGSRLNHATLDEACLIGANLTECDLTAIEARNLQLVDADLRNAMIAGLDLRKIDLQGVKILEWQQRQLLETIGMEILAE